ncbi:MULTISPECIES: hypothetical protein [unclassified Bradyrhizobium]|uniref:hypothetical protein n=1 Tax=unclassified Bradyrhizobium TaxID=2631580 RepID=UPI0028E36CAB|nr:MULTISPECIES: hypothetical protein [unclassified Bradyrhizobium]
MQVCLLSPWRLIPTEEVDPDRVTELQAQILDAARWAAPVTAEKDALFVMDGHHRLAVARRLQLRLMPVILLDYSAVRVESWRPGETITPTCIFAMVVTVTVLDCTPEVRHDNFSDIAGCHDGYRALFCANAASNSRGDW